MALLKYFTIYPPKKTGSLQLILNYNVSGNTRHLRTGLLQNIRNDEASKNADKSWFAVDDAFWFHFESTCQVYMRLQPRISKWMTKLIVVEQLSFPFSCLKYEKRKQVMKELIIINCLSTHTFDFNWPVTCNYKLIDLSYMVYLMNSKSSTVSSLI